MSLIYLILLLGAGMGVMWLFSGVGMVLWALWEFIRSPFDD